MGHYYSEMCCQKCGEIHCICPETLEIERKYASMSWEEKEKLKLRTLLKAMDLARKMEKERKRRKK